MGSLLPTTIFAGCFTAALWLLVVAFTVAAFTVAPDAINAAIGIGVAAVVMTGMSVACLIDDVRSRRG